MVDDDAGALARERDRGRPADAARAAGDDRNLALEQHRLARRLRSERREAGGGAEIGVADVELLPGKAVARHAKQRKAIASAGSRGLVSFSRGSFATGTDTGGADRLLHRGIDEARRETEDPDASSRHIPRRASCVSMARPAFAAQ